jgi:predicted ATPase
VSSEEITFLEGRCLSYGRGIAYHPVIDVLKSNFDVQEGDADTQIREKVKKGLKIIGADEATTLPYLLELLSVEDTGIDETSVSPESRRDRILEAVKQIALYGSQLRPLVMAFEDLHWADKTSEDVLKSLMESIAGAKILLIFTYRPEFIHTWGGKSFHSQVNLNRLSNRESLRMVTHLFGTEDIDGDLEELILDKTEGVPFFIEEFLKSLKDLKIIEKKANRIHLKKDVQELAIPSTIQDVIMARIDSLPEEAKEVLQTGAVIDREFCYELLKQVTGLPQQELLSSLSSLKDAELLYERGVFPQSTYIFKHALTQEVAYDGLLQKRRKEIHQNIGNTMEALYADRLEENYEFLAHHYSHSENKQKAAKYLDLANRKACRASAAEEAKGYFDQALAVLEEMSHTEKNRELLISLLGNQTDVFELLLRIPEYYEILTRYEPMVGTVRNPGLEGTFYASLGNCELAFCYFDQAVQTLRKAGDLCEAAGNAEGAGYAYEVLMWVHLWKGDLEQTLMLRQRVHQKMQEKFNLRTSVWSSTAASWACSFLGRWNEAAGHAKEALSTAQEYADGSLTSFAATSVALAFIFKYDLDPATKNAEMAAQKAPTPFDEAVANLILGFAWSRAGKANKGIEILHQAIQIYRASQYMLGLLGGLPFLCEAYVLAGKYDRARETAEEASELANRLGAKYLLGWVCRLLGEIALAENRDEVAPHFERAISIAREIKAENDLALAYSGIGRYHKQQRNTEEARKYLTDALEIFERLGTRIEPDKARKELAELPQ